MKKLSPKMQECLEYFQEHKILVRYNGGFWGREGAELDKFGAPRPYYNISTITALMRRDLVMATDFNYHRVSGVWYPIKFEFSSQEKPFSGLSGLESMITILKAERDDEIDKFRRDRQKGNKIIALGAAFSIGYDEAIEITEGMKEAEEEVAETQTPEDIKKRNALLSTLFLNGLYQKLDDQKHRGLMQSFEQVVQYIQQQHLL